MKKVFAYLQGGLGNQCFIYAAARAMALDAGAKVYARADRFVGDGYRREYALDDFNCQCQVLAPRRKVIRSAHYYYHALIRKLGMWRLFNTINEREWFKYHRMPANWFGAISIDGYWQSECYFKRHANAILEDFSLKDSSWLARDAMAARIIGDRKSVFLHVRSYKDISAYKDGSYALPIPYYENALSYIAEKVEGGTVYVFSDDLAWAMNRLEASSLRGGFTLVPVFNDESILPRGKYSSSYLRDFTLMRLCRHGIIADSSFSWWAGWLGERERLLRGDECIRIRPDKGEINNFYPNRWIPITVHQLRNTI